MASVSCPSCGTVNVEGQRKLARCRNCHEWLIACRYCAHYDARLMDCVHPARPDWLRIVDATESLNCPDFTSILTGAAVHSRVWRVLRTATITAVLAGLGFLGVVRGYEAVIAPAPPVLLRASVSVPTEASRSTGFDVRIFVRNEADRPAEDVQVLLTGPAMRDIACDWVEPPEAFVEATPKTVCAWLGNLEPGAIGTVQFHFTATDACQVKLTAQVVAANVEGPHRVPIEGEILP